MGDLKAQFDVKKGSGDEKGIPNFWLETLQAFRITAEMIQEHDEPVLAYLQDIRVRMHEKKPYGYTLEFEFAENPFFTNKVLTKTFELKIDVDATVIIHPFISLINTIYTIDSEFMNLNYCTIE